MASNPFSTRFIRPGAQPFLFDEGVTVQSVVQRLREHGWNGQIVGPHGSGKSTLLAMLVQRLREEGRSVVVCRLTTAATDVGPPALASAEETHMRNVRPAHFDVHKLPLARDGQLAIDGFEQLSWFGRRRAIRECQAGGVGLLVTAHRDVGLPMLYQTQPTPALARRVVAQVLGDAAGAIEDADIAEAYTASGGNIRETLFLLFDVFQRRAGAGQVDAP